MMEDVVTCLPEFMEDEAPTERVCSEILMAIEDSATAMADVRRMK